MVKVGFGFRWALTPLSLLQSPTHITLHRCILSQARMHVARKVSMKLFRLFQCLAVTLFLCSGTMLRAQIDSDAQQLLEETADFLFKAEGVYVSMDVDVRSLEEGAKTPRTFSQIQIAARRPNLYARHVRSEGVLRDALVSDGRTVSRYCAPFAAWDQKPAPVSMELLLVNDEFAKTAIVPRLLTSHGYKDMTEGITAAHMAPDRDVKGTNCKVVAFEEADGTGEFVIQAGEEPLLREYRFENKTVRVLLTYNRWDIRSDLAEELFKFSPDPNARQVPSVDALVARGGKTSDDLPAYKLVGELAPDIALPMLSGESFRLSKVEHKQAIMLVFWSSTEKRSNAMLPSMTELTDGLMSSGVALYTINLKESEETIREYMTKQRHQFLVAMDSAGDTVAPYKIGPLPQIVIIDKNNVVRFVHIGLTPKVIIQKELESFIKIVPEDTPKPEKKSSSKKKKSAKG